MYDMYHIHDIYIDGYYSFLKCNILWSYYHSSKLAQDLINTYLKHLKLNKTTVRMTSTDPVQWSRSMIALKLQTKPNVGGEGF